MELRQLKYFLKIAEFGNMTRAAEVLHIAQPALSQQIRNLEDELEVQLFNRYSNGVRLTEAGCILKIQAKKILGQVDETLVMVRSERDMPTGEVVLGLPSSTARILAIPLLSALLSTHPGIRLKFIEAPSAEMVKLLTRGDADLVIAVDPSPATAFSSIPLGTELLYLITLPTINDPKLEGVTIAQIAKFPLFLMPAPNSIRLSLDAAFRRDSLTYNLVSEITSTTVLVQAVRAGIGSTVLPWSAIGDEVIKGYLTGTPLSDSDIVRKLWMCTLLRSEENSAVQAVRSLTVAVIEQLVETGSWQGMLLPKQAT